MVNSLHHIWNDLLSRYTQDAELVDELWYEIEKSYTKKSRRYHNLNHLLSMFELVSEVIHKLKSPDVVYFAIFYHDIVYNVIFQDNEERSSIIAKKNLKRIGLNDYSIQKCVDMIVSTKYHKLSNDSDTNYLLDIDMSILGYSRDKYLEYVENVRKEYSVYPNLVYNIGRSKALNGFLSSNIFHTKEFSEKYEESAKTNIQYEVDSILIK